MRKPITTIWRPSMSTACWGMWRSDSWGGRSGRRSPWALPLWGCSSRRWSRLWDSGEWSDDGFHESVVGRVAGDGVYGHADGRYPVGLASANVSGTALDGLRRAAALDADGLSVADPAAGRDADDGGGGGGGSPRLVAGGPRR